MKISIKATPKEIAALVVALQGQQKEKQAKNRSEKPQAKPLKRDFTQ